MEELQTIRHSLAHVLAKALKKYYGDVLLTIGPATADGFYYDIDLGQNLTSEDMPKIEAEMKKIINNNEKFEKIVVSKEKALELFKDNPYKTEIISELPDGEEISIYKLGEGFFDLCRGPHVASTSKLSNAGFEFKAINGAYWRGSEKNKMLQRVYFYAFANKAELAEHKKQVQEALKRDHNKLGRELEYFTTVDYIGQGLPIMLPKGAKTIQIMQRFVEDEEAKRGYLLTKTPLISKTELFKISGHLDHYRESMFIWGDEEKGEAFALRPMTCPFQYQVFLNRTRSYKDLPMRLAETSTLFRNEASGECHGLIRLRQFTISEGHIIVTPEQLEDEFRNCVDLAKYSLGCMGLGDDVSFRFSKWDENNKEKYIGSKEEWDRVQDKMREILNDLKIPFVEADGEAAFYGPKLDIQIKNVFGKEDTIITIQIDFQIAERFQMFYTDADGVKKNPYIIHRTSVGCYERTLAYLIEKYAGALPLWLAPEQVRILTINERNKDYAQGVADKFIENGLRITTDFRNETIGYKIREAMSQKLPYLVIIGEEEESNKTISIRGRGFENLSGLKVEDFINRLKEEVKTFKK